VTTALTGRAATAASAPVLAVLNKMVAAGVPLEAYCGGIHSGISSAAEHVFVIDRRTRDQLVAQDASSAEILKPYLTAKDIRPWRIEERDLRVRSLICYRLRCSTKQRADWPKRL
jgi:hypothetical protein